MSGGRALKASTTTTKGKENVAPVGMTKEDGQVDTRKRKQAPTAAANGAAKKGKAKAVDVDEDDALDDKEELRAALAAVSSLRLCLVDLAGFDLNAVSRQLQSTASTIR